MTDTALLVVDMLNAYRHPDAEVLAGNVADIVEPLADLIRQVRDRDDVELIYVNDNDGDFTAEPSDIVRAALLMTKVRHSVFYATPLDYLLSRASTSNG